MNHNTLVYVVELYRGGYEPGELITATTNFQQAEAYWLAEKRDTVQLTTWDNGVKVAQISRSQEDDDET